MPNKEDNYKRIETITGTDDSKTGIMIDNYHISLFTDYEFGRGSVLIEKNDDNLNLAFILEEMIKDHLNDSDEYSDIAEFFGSEFKSLFRIRKGFSTGYDTIKYRKSEQPPIIKNILNEHLSDFHINYNEDSGTWEIGEINEVGNGDQWMDTFETYKFLVLGSGKIKNTDLATGIIKNRIYGDDFYASDNYIVYLNDQKLLEIHEDIRFAYSIAELIKKHLTDYANIEKKNDDIKLVPKNKPDFTF